MRKGKKMWQRGFALVLAMCIALSGINFPVYADENEQTTEAGTEVTEKESGETQAYTETNEPTEAETSLTEEESSEAETTKESERETQEAKEEKASKRSAAKKTVRTLDVNTATSIREWCIAFLQGKGVALDDDADDVALRAALTANYEYFEFFFIPANVTDMEGLETLLYAMGDVRQYGNGARCEMLLWCEVDTEIYHDIYNRLYGKDFRPAAARISLLNSAVWEEFYTRIDTKGIDFVPTITTRNPNQIYQFIDGIPQNFYLPVPISLIDHDKNIINHLSNAEGGFSIKRSTVNSGEAITTPQEDGRSIKVSDMTSGTLILENRYYFHVAVLVGSSGGEVSQSAANIFYDYIYTKYSVSLEPLTTGAEDDTPLLSGVNTTETPLADWLETNKVTGDSPLNSTTNINRGTNTATDSSGSNAAGADIRIAGTESNGVGNRTTGFGDFGDTGISVDPKPANGYELDYYKVDIYNPVTNELEESYPEISQEELDALLAKGIQGKTKIFVAYANDSKITFDKSSPQADTRVKKGDTIVYNLTLTNSGEAQEVTVKDVLPAQVEAKKYEVSINGVSQGEELGWPESLLLTLPKAEVDEDEVVTPSEIVISITTEVTADWDADENKNNIITNQAVLTYDGGDDIPSKIITNYIDPKVSFTIDKNRITKAEEFVAGNYGFKPGEEVTYKILIANTGELALSMDVNDIFEDEDYFENITFKSVTGTGVTTNGSGTAGMNITIPVASTATVTVTAKVAADAPYSLSGTAEDDGKGYANTAAAENVVSDTYDKVIDVTYDEDGNIIDYEIDDTATINLDDDTAQATTPVQPKASYTITKERITAAPEVKDEEGNGTGKYGFPVGSTIGYEIVVTNTGSIDLTMDVGDAYEIPEYFENLTYGTVTGEGVTENRRDEHGVNLTIAAGKAATVAVTAEVTKKAKQILAETAADDGNGHKNTASASQVTYTYQDSDGATQTGTVETDDAEAFTPVQKEKEITFSKDSPSNGAHVKKGETIVYNLTVNNTGEEKAVTITDALPSHVEAKNYTVTVGTDDPATFDGWPGSLDLTLPAAETDENGVLVPGQIIVSITTVVVADWDAEDTQNNVISNQATLTYGDDDEIPSDIITNYLDPKVAFTIEKNRISAATGLPDGGFGFAVGAEVTYEIVIANTGDLELTMDVNDTFTEAAYFEDITYKSADGEGVVTNSSDANGMNITIPAGKTATVTVTAKVTAGTPYLLAGSAQDDGNGYVNTAKAENVVSEEYDKVVDVTYDENGNIIAVDTEKDTMNAESQEDTANTPVLPKSSYTLAKTRITEAPEVLDADGGGTGKYGFKAGDTVTYEITAVNTGTVDLNMDISDVFKVPSYFRNLTYVSATGEGIILKGSDENGMNITIPVGKTAVITVTAVVSVHAEEELSDSAQDDKKGHKNIGTASNVTYTYETPDGTKEGNGEDEEAEAFTPVQKGEEVSFSKDSPTDGQHVKKGDTIIYDLTVSNTGKEKAVTITDILPGQVEAQSYQVTTGTITSEPITGWPGTLDLTLPSADMSDEDNIIPSQITISITTIVTADWDADTNQNNVITNQATLSYDGKDIPSEIITNYLEPEATFTIEKNRTSKAAGLESGGFGFAAGTEVTYEIIIANTGDLALTMDVSDAFKEDMYFENITYVSAEGAGVTTNRSDENGMNITIPAGVTATVTVTAKVAKDTPYLLSNHAEDDGKGYQNTATAENVVSEEYDKITEVTYDENGNITDITTEKDTITVETQNDTANTPVLPDASYTISKERTTIAPEVLDENGNGTGKYGFKAGDTVTYEITVENTGTIELTMDISDTFEFPTYFRNMMYVSAAGEGVVLNRSDEGGMNITISSGKTAVITVTAVVAIHAEELLSDTATDDGNGHKNIGTATNVTYTYEDPDGNEQEGTGEDKEDEAFTPVEKDEEVSITKESPTDGSRVKKGDKITYTLTTCNMGDAKEVTITDTLPKQVAAKSYTLTIDGVPQTVTGNWTGALTVTLPASVIDENGNDSPSVTIIEIEAEVTADWYHADNQNNVISNQATLEYDGKEIPTEIITHYEDPGASFILDKKRITEAVKFTDGNYGFAAGETVTYEITAANTGDLKLTMNVEDIFAEADYFENVTYQSVTGEGVVTNRIDENGVNITIPAGKSAVVTVTAVVAKDTPYLLSAAAQDDGKGYQNTAKASNVQPESYEKITEVTYDGDGNIIDIKTETTTPEVDDKEATANTPVRPTPSYTIEKQRITGAPAKENNTGYGFKPGAKVTYEVKVENTGDIDLSLDVSDTFTETEYFKDLTYMAVKGADITCNTNLPSDKAVNITVPAGKTAVVTITAVVSDKALEKLASAADSDEGYKNTAKASNVEGSYTDTDGNPGKVTATDQEDIAHTPVQSAGILRILKIDADTKEPLKGAVLAILDKDGNELETWISTGIAHEVTSHVIKGENYTLVEKSAPKGYLLAESVTFIAFENGSEQEVKMSDKKMQATNDNEIKITKYVMYNDEYRSTNYSFYVALFWDEACTQRATEAKELKLEASYQTTASFKNLPAGTYYAAETDEEGTPLDVTSESAMFTNKITDKKLVITNDQKEYFIEIINYIQNPPGGFLLEDDGEIVINKKVVSGNGEKAVTDTFYFTLFGDEEMTHIIRSGELAFENESSKTLTFSKLPYGTYYIAETDQEGNILDDDFAYEVSLDKAEVTLTSAEKKAQVAAVNTIAETTRLRVTKIWKDNDNAAGARPKSVVIDLYRDGEVIDQLTLSEENEWRGFFENLPVGTTTWTYSYEVREQAVKDYTASYSQVSREWTVMNKYTKGTTNAGNKPAVRGPGSSKAASGVKTGDNTNILLWVLLLVAAGGFIGIMWRRKERKG